MSALSHTRGRAIYTNLVCAAFSLVFFFGGAVLHVNAATVVSDTEISSDTTWTKAASPYLLSQDLIIDGGVTLTLEPGTIVKIGNGSWFFVFGTLQGHGTASDKIYFTSDEDDTLGGDSNEDGDSTTPYYYDWGGIYSSQSRVDLSNAVIHYADAAFNPDEDSVVNLDGLEVSFSGDAVSSYHADVTLLNSSITDLDNSGFDVKGGQTTVSSTTIQNIGADAAGFYRGATAHFNNVTISDVSHEGFLLFDNSTGTFSHSSINNTNYQAVGVYDSTLNFFDSSVGGIVSGYSAGIHGEGGNVTVSGSSFDTDTEAGIELYKSRRMGNGSSLDVASSTFKNFWYAGISVGDLTSGKIEGNDFENNYIGLDIWNSPTTVVSGNSIHGNSIGLSFGPNTEVGDVRGNYWGDASGPFTDGNLDGLGDPVEGNVQYAPWLTEDPLVVPLPECCSSVAFIPGLEGSRLYKQGLISENELWLPNRNADVEKLYLDSNGKSLDTSVYTRDILDTVPFINLNIYKSLMTTLDGMVTDGTIAEWKALPYDWRLSLDDIIDGGSKLQDGSIDYEIAEIERLAAGSKNGKVTIVTHSNGGLVAKLLLQKLDAKGEAGLVERLVMIAAPQLGTPKALIGMLHGSGEGIAGGFVEQESTARTLGVNMPGAYQLLPSEKYFEKVAEPVVKFDPSIDSISNFRATYGDDIHDYAKLQDFLRGTDGRNVETTDPTYQPLVLNGGLLTQAASTHASLDSSSLPANVKVIQVVGWGLDTISGIEYKTTKPCLLFCSPILDPQPIFTDDGDETVVVPSASAVGGETYFVNMVEAGKKTAIGYKHKNITEIQSVLDLVRNFVIESTATPDFVTVTEPVSETKHLRLSVHSPVSIDLYDDAGNHTGPAENPNPDSDLKYIEEQIPNSYYLEFGEGKYAGFDGDNPARVELHGTGAGTFTLDVDEATGDSIDETTEYKNIPVSTSTTATFTHTDEGNILEVDNEGDGVVDETYSTSTDASVVPEPSPTPTPEPSPSPDPTPTPTPDPTPSPEPSPTPTPDPTPSPTPSPEPTPSESPSPSPSESPTPSPDPTPSDSPSPEPSPSESPSPSPTPENTESPSPSPEPSLSPTPDPTPSPSESSSPTPSLSPSPSSDPTPSPSESPSPSPSESPSPSPQPEAGQPPAETESPSPTPTPSETPSPTPTPIHHRHHSSSGGSVRLAEPIPTPIPTQTIESTPPIIAEVFSPIPPVESPTEEVEKSPDSTSSSPQSPTTEVTPMVESSKELAAIASSEPSSQKWTKPVLYSSIFVGVFLIIKLLITLF